MSVLLGFLAFLKDVFVFTVRLGLDLLCIALAIPVAVSVIRTVPLFYDLGKVNDRGDFEWACIKHFLYLFIDLICYPLAIIAAILPWRTYTVIKDLWQVDSQCTDSGSTDRWGICWEQFFCSLADMICFPLGLLALVLPWRLPYLLMDYYDNVEWNDNNVNDWSDLRRQMLYGFITTVYDMIALPAGLLPLALPWRAMPCLCSYYYIWRSGDTLPTTKKCKSCGGVKVYNCRLRKACFEQLGFACLDLLLIPLGILALMVPSRTISVMTAYHYAVTKYRKDGDDRTYKGLKQPLTRCNMRLRRAAIVQFLLSLVDVLLLPALLVSLLRASEVISRSRKYFAENPNSYEKPDFYLIERRFIILQEAWNALLDLTCLLCLALCLVTGLRARRCLFILKNDKGLKQRRRIVLEAVKLFVIDLPVFVLLVLPIMVTLWRLPTLVNALYAATPKEIKREDIRDEEWAAICGQQWWQWCQDIPVAACTLLLLVTMWRAPHALRIFGPGSTLSGRQRRKAIYLQIAFLLRDMPFLALFGVLAATLYRLPRVMIQLLSRSCLLDSPPMLHLLHLRPHFPEKGGIKLSIKVVKPPNLPTLTSVSVYVCSEEFWSGLESILGRSVVMLAKSMQPLQALPKYLLNVQELNQAKEGEEVTLMVDMSSLGIKRKTLVKKLGQLPSHTAFTIRCQGNGDRLVLFSFTCRVGQFLTAAQEDETTDAEPQASAPPQAGAELEGATDKDAKLEEARPADGASSSIAVIPKHLPQPADAAYPSFTCVEASAAKDLEDLLNNGKTFQDRLWLIVGPEAVELVMDIVHLVLFVATWLLPHRGIALLVVLFESDERWTARLLGKSFDFLDVLENRWSSFSKQFERAYHMVLKTGSLKHNSVLDVAARHASSSLYNYHHSWGSADQRLWSLFALKEASCLQDFKSREMLLKVVLPIVKKNADDKVTAAWLRMLNSEMQLNALLGLSSAELFGYKTVYNHEELSAIASTQYLNKPEQYYRLKQDMEALQADRATVVLELRQAQAVNKETKLKALFKPSIKGFLGRELSLSRTMIRNLFGAMLSDIMVGALFILVLASGYRAPILIRHLRQATTRDWQRLVVMEQALQLVIDLLHLPLFLVVLGTGYYFLEMAVDMSAQIFDYDSIHGARKVVRLYARRVGQDLCYVLSFAAVWKLYKWGVAVAVWGIFLPAEMLSQIMVFFNVCNSIDSPFLQRFWPFATWLVLFAFPFLFTRAMIPALLSSSSSVLTADAYNAISGALAVFLGVIALLTFGALGVASRTEGFKRVAPRSLSRSLMGFMQLNGANAMAIINIGVDSFQLAGLALKSINHAVAAAAGAAPDVAKAGGSGGGIAGAAGVGPVARWVSNISSFVLLQFGSAVAGPASRLMTRIDSVLDQTVLFWGSVGLVVAWYFIISAPVVVEDLLEWSQKGSIRSNRLWRVLVGFLSQTLYFSIVANLVSPLSCHYCSSLLDDPSCSSAGSAYMSGQPSVACWTGVSGQQSTMALVSMLCLFFYVLTAHILSADAGVLLSEQDDELDVRYPMVYQFGVQTAKFLLIVLSMLLLRLPWVFLAVFLAGTIALAGYTLSHQALFGTPACIVPAVVLLRVAGYAVAGWAAVVAMAGLSGLSSRESDVLALSGWGGILLLLAIALMVQHCRHNSQAEVREHMELLGKAQTDLLTLFTDASTQPKETALLLSSFGEEPAKRWKKRAIVASPNLRVLSRLTLELEESLRVDAITPDFVRDRPQWRERLRTLEGGAKGLHEAVTRLKSSVSQARALELELRTMHAVDTEGGIRQGDALQALSSCPFPLLGLDSKYKAFNADVVRWLDNTYGEKANDRCMADFYGRAEEYIANLTEEQKQQLEKRGEDEGRVQHVSYAVDMYPTAPPQEPSDRALDTFGIRESASMDGDSADVEMVAADGDSHAAGTDSDAVVLEMTTQKDVERNVENGPCSDSLPGK